MSLHAAPPPFSAVLLAGGRSTRMGRDKAGLVIAGTPLWQIQIEKLRVLGPAGLFISGRRGGPYEGSGVEIVEDAIPGLGPLGGIAAALTRAQTPRVLVLAIDLPAITPEFLAALLRTETAVVPRDADAFEPLAAIYPKSALTIAEEMLREEDRSMQRFVRRLIDAQLAQARMLSADETRLFKNLNQPGDLG